MRSRGGFESHIAELVGTVLVLVIVEPVHAVLVPISVSVFEHEEAHGCCKRTRAHITDVTSAVWENGHAQASLTTNTGHSFVATHKGCVSVIKHTSVATKRTHTCFSHLCHKKDRNLG